MSRRDQQIVSPAIRRLRGRWHSVAHALHQDETGASYYLSVVLLLPLYLMLLIVTVELALLLNAKLAVTHAAYAAARAAVVWQPAGELPAEARLGMVYAAAASAIAPVASGNPRHVILSSPYFQYPEQAPTDWAHGYLNFTKAKHDSDYLARKYAYAARAIRIRVVEESEDFNGPVTIVLEYEHPFHTSGAAGLFGRVASWLGRAMRTTTIQSTVTLEKEGFRPTDSSSAPPNGSIAFHPDFGFTAVSW